MQLLDEGSRALAQGNYARRLPETGQDELSDLAHNFNVMAGALEQVEQGRVELIGNVAHELRAPLAALRGYADAMQDGVMTPEHAAQSISREIGAMDRLVRDLSLVSRVEAGKVELHLKAIDPQGLLQIMRERFATPFEDKGVQLQITDAVLPQIKADEERTLQVLTNLLSNALRHTPAGGKVSVTVQTEAALLKFNVQDTGTGFPPNTCRASLSGFTVLILHVPAMKVGAGWVSPLPKGWSRRWAGRCGWCLTWGRAAYFPLLCLPSQS